MLRPFLVKRGIIVSIEQVKTYLAHFGREGDVIEFTTSSATVELAAKALGVEGARIAKSLAFVVENGCVLVVAAGDARVDNQKFKARFGCKAKMTTPEQTVAFTGHAIGGVCPFALPKGAGTKVYLDESLKRFQTVYPACGSSNSAIEVTLAELEEYSCFEGYVDVCKAWREE